MMALDLKDKALAGIASFYAIVNIPKESLPSVFRETARVLRPGGMLLLAFHMGDEGLQEKDPWGRPISMDFFLFQPSAIREYIEAAGLNIHKIIEREPYAPEVEYQSRRAYVFARKTGVPVCSQGPYRCDICTKAKECGKGYTGSCGG
jgi:SAM-dependent methyltransferase